MRMAAVTRWDVDALRAETKDRRRARRRRRLKKRPMRGWTCSTAPLGCMCSWTTRSVPGSSRHARSRGTSGAIWPGRPAEKVTVGIHRPSGPSDRRSPAPDRARRASREPARAIESDVGVMHDARVARLKLDAGDVLRRVDRQRDDEDAKHIARRGGQLKGAGGVTTRSGVPSCHPSVNRGASGSRLGRLRSRRHRPSGEARRSHSPSAASVRRTCRRPLLAGTAA